MRSPHSTIPAVHITRTDDGWHITCTTGDLDERRASRLAADLVATEHEKTHGRWR